MEEINTGSEVEVLAGNSLGKGDVVPSVVDRVLQGSGCTGLLPANVSSKASSPDALRSGVGHFGKAIQNYRPKVSSF